jgi:hypothetical protein
LKKLGVIIGLFFCLAQVSFTQVTGVKYQLAYDGNSNKYFFLLHITKGRAETRLQRTLGSSQLTVVAPKNTNLIMTNLYKPVTDKKEPCKFDVRSTIDSPTVTKDLSYHSIVNDLSPVSTFDTISKGDVIQLFAFKASPQPANFKDIRLFINGQDPASSAPGMFGGDFRNGMSIGGGQSFEGVLDYGVLSLSTELPNDKIKVYPNPVKDELQISSNEALKKVTLKTIDGRVILETTESNIDMSKFARGIYLIDVVSGDTRVLRKIIKND